MTANTKCLVCGQSDHDGRPDCTILARVFVPGDRSELDPDNTIPGEDEYALFRDTYMDHLAGMLETRFQPPFWGRFEVGVLEEIGGASVRVECNHRKCDCYADVADYVCTERVHLACLDAGLIQVREFGPCEPPCGPDRCTRRGGPIPCREDIRP